MGTLSVTKSMVKPNMGLLSLSVVAVLTPIAFLLVAYHYQVGVPSGVEIASNIWGGIVAAAGLLIKIHFFLFR